MFDNSPEQDFYLEELDALITEGEIQAWQTVAMELVAVRFPALVGLVAQRVEKIGNLFLLQKLVQQISIAPNELMIRWLLDMPED
jgi:hypothetical protein